MYRRIRVGLLASAVASAALWAAPPELLSKKFAFKSNVLLDIGDETVKGMRLDSVRFSMASEVEERLHRTGGLPQAEVAVSNTGEEPLRIGIAIALFDPQGRLLGVASGSTKLAPIQPGRQKTFKLEVEGVYAEVPKATVFQISLETK